MTVQILKVISHLLDYPSEGVRANQGELALAISNATEVSPDMRSQLLETLKGIYRQDLMDAQEQYSGLFDHGRALSLHLFEHVHGESRDRGQAMVDLLRVYEKQGFVLDQHELPDYIPLFLEFLSWLEPLDAREWLADMSHILALLAARLAERGSPYACLFAALLMICGRQDLIEEHRAAAAQEARDDTPEALDREWEEAAVTFSPPGDCDSKRTARHAPVQQAQPLHWVDPASAATNQIGGQAQ